MLSVQAENINNIGNESMEIDSPCKIRSTERIGVAILISDKRDFKAKIFLVSICQFLLAYKEIIWIANVV